MLEEKDVLAALDAVGESPAVRFLNRDSLKEMISFWFNGLGVPSKYFQYVSADVCFKHISSIVSSMSKSLANQVSLDIDISFESEDFCVYIIPSSVSLTEGGKMRFEIDTQHTAPVSAEDIETFLENKYFHAGSSADFTINKKGKDGKQLGVKQSQLNVNLKPSGDSTISLESSTGSVTPAKGNYRVQVSRTPAALSQDIPVHLRFYLLEKCAFKEDADESSPMDLADERFHKEYNDKAKDAFQQVIQRTMELKNPTAEVFENMNHEGETSTLLLVSHYTLDSSGVFVGMPNVYRRYCMYAHSKHVEIFKNGVIVFAFFLQPVDYIRDVGGAELTADEGVDSRIAHIKQDASLHYVLPKTSYSFLVEDGIVSMQEMVYAYSAAKFAFHFLSRGQNDRRAIASGLGAESVTALAALSRLTAALSEFAFTENAIRAVISNHIPLVQALYGDFASKHMPSNLKQASDCPNVEILADGKRIDAESMSQLIVDSCRSEESRAIFQMFAAFNKHVLKTNFYKPEKRAISFRLHPDFLSAEDYPERPFGVFMMVGAEFRGFHVRFRDIARGGVRMVRSRDSLAYHSNLTKMFDECFNLASTQQRKNKDIPEGGSKGVILLGVHHQNNAQIAFQKYVDALLDVLLPNPTWCNDLYNEEELIFLGPDEGTADFMDWASEHSRGRGYRYWKAFTTGKSPSRGGIPHDRFGMTTTSVRAYVNGILRKLKVDHETCTKFQTGGPDGDLGSNEILMGKEKTVAVIDGSGVAFDPEGLDAEELKRLARGRKMVDDFDKDKLSAQGFFVNVTDSDITLPNGVIVKSGFQFRNEFHLNPMLHVDLFVPCGGRPNSVTDQNYKQLLFDTDGKPRVKYIVEGANLFFTQESRRLIEKNGIKLVKDASANKGGVTSSSLEVLAALALSDEEHEKTMQVKDIDNPPQTYKDYVEEVLSVIQKAADNEFEALWSYSQETDEPMCDSSDLLSNKIVLMRDAIQQSPSLFSDEKLRLKVLRRAIPEKLCTIVPFETIVSRLPESYLKALFASYLSSHFVYEKGLKASDIAFYEYANTLE
eukprot:m.130910 g.130910  ORF g.130910 m.130910 type:complete len:1056 (-) comp13064_c0_seq1:492-3659(-)